MALQRSRNRVIAGVCAGLAEEWDMEPNVVRVLYAIVSLLTGVVLGILVYILLYLVMEDPPAP